MQAQVVPVFGVRLFHTLLLRDDEARQQAAKHAKRHGNAVVVMALDDGTAQLAHATRALDFNTVVKLAARYTAFGQLHLHHLDAVALLYTLVGHTKDARRATRHRRQHSSRHKGIRHGLHVEITQTLERARSRALHSGLRGTLLNRAAHLGKQVTKGSIALHTASPHCLTGNLASGNCSNGKGVCGGRGVGLDVVERRIHIALVGNEIAVVCGLRDGNAKVLHHAHRHFDIGLRNGLVLLELQRHIPLPQRRRQQNA
mmetsp:Transcript_11394/g.18046  ORF Transcript_11394/g.18046 Transcript_11394/m.18046 type:complete len:257 (+) Transcript_11394:1614-2384(+)